MRVLNFGSLNVDHVYRVEHISRPGETIPSGEYRRFAGGKGANQSVALARAGAQVYHAGKVGPESAWLKQKLAADGVNVDLVAVADSPGGHAIIQVDRNGENSIVLFGGTNQSITATEVDRALAVCQPGDWLLLQNEINVTADLIARGNAAGLKVCLNPAPFTEAVRGFPLDLVDLLIVNEPEGAGLAGGARGLDPILAALRAQLPQTLVVLTLGSEGVVCAAGANTIRVPARKVNAVDTTGAGDTFVGYLLAGLIDGMPLRGALDFANHGAAVSVTRPGAMDAIPRRSELG